MATALARASRKTRTTLDMRTGEQKQGSQDGFSANIFSGVFFVVFFPKTHLLVLEGVGVGMIDSATFSHPPGLIFHLSSSKI